MEIFAVGSRAHPKRPKKNPQPTQAAQATQATQPVQESAAAEENDAQEDDANEPANPRGGVDSVRFLAARSTKLPSRVLKQPAIKDPNELLDDRDCPDPDESSLDNEQRLSKFIRLHPCLSLEATSHRTLSAAAELIGKASVKTKPAETCSKAHDDLFLRPARDGERECVNGDTCIVNWLAGFRYGEASEYAFTCREFLTPSEQETYEKSGELPQTQSKCLVCARYFQTYLYTICRSDPNFTLTPTIALQAFCNDPTKEDVVQTLGSKTRSKGEYKPEKLLFIDEKFKNSNAGRGELSHLVWQPTVRFNSKDYEFALDEEKRPFLVQVDMEMDQSPENNGGGSSVPEHTQIVGVQQPDPLRDPDAEEPVAATEQQQDAAVAPHFRRPLP